MAAPTLQSSFAHAGNPTTAPTGTLGTTQADDILFVVVTNGGSDSDPTMSGTTITTGGLTWTKKVSANGGALTDLNGSLWWTRATGNHTGQTIIAATTNSGSLVGGVVRGAVASGDPFDNTATALNASGVNTITGFTPSVDECLVALGLCTDDNIASDTYAATGSPSTLTERQDALSTGGVDTAAALATGAQTTAAAIGVVTWNNGRGAGIYQVAILAAVKPIPVHVLVVADATHGHAADEVALTQVHNLTVADGAHAHASDQVALTQVHALVVDEAPHAHVADNVSLTQVHVLVVAEATHAHTAESCDVTPDGGTHDLVVNDSAHAHAADVVVLVQVHALTVADAAHAHAVDTVALTQLHALLVADTSHAHAVDNVGLTQQGAAVPATSAPTVAGAATSIAATSAPASSTPATSSPATSSPTVTGG